MKENKELTSEEEKQIIEMLSDIDLNNKGIYDIYTDDIEDIEKIISEDFNLINEDE